MEKFGYDKLADLLGRYPECTVYRRFGALGAKKLLHQQAEISILEHELQIQCTYDQSNDPDRMFATSWLKMDAGPKENGANLQSQKTRKLFEKLGEYHDNLLRTKQVLSMTSPTKPELTFLREWLDSELGGNGFLKCFESEPYEDDHTNDLVTLSPASGKDPFAQVLSNKIVPWYHRRIGHRRKAAADETFGPVWEYKHQLFERMADVMCAILSSMIPVTSIFLLYFVHSTLRKLIIATAMNFLFSFIVAMVVRGRRADVFAASTAFAAIQVVFIGGVNIILKKQ